MLFSFFTLSLSAFAFGPTVTELNDVNFQNLIMRRDNNTVWMVLFHDPQSEENEETYKNFQEAADDNHGLVRFAQIDAHKNVRTPQMFRVSRLPLILIFHSKGVHQYQGNGQARSIINVGAGYILDYSKEVDETWKDKDSVILFSAKDKTPPLWSAISYNFSTSSIAVGFTNNETVREAFNISTVPTVYFNRPPSTKIYEGEFKYDMVQEAILSFFEYTFPTPTPRPTPTPKTYVPTVGVISDEKEFKEKCKKGHKFCVIASKEFQTEKFTQLAFLFKNDPFQFLKCGDKCPVTGMEKGIYVFHTKRDVGKYAKDLDELEMELGRIVSGTPKWEKTEEIFKEKPKEL